MSQDKLGPKEENRMLSVSGTSNLLAEYKAPAFYFVPFSGRARAQLWVWSQQLASLTITTAKNKNKKEPQPLTSRYKIYISPQG